MPYRIVAIGMMIVLSGTLAACSSTSKPPPTPYLKKVPAGGDPSSTSLQTADNVFLPSPSELDDRTVQDLARSIVKQKNLARLDLLGTPKKQYGAEIILVQNGPDVTTGLYVHIGLVGDVSLGEGGQVKFYVGDKLTWQHPFEGVARQEAGPGIGLWEIICKVQKSQIRSMTNAGFSIHISGRQSEKYVLESRPHNNEIARKFLTELEQ